MTSHSPNYIVNTMYMHRQNNLPLTIHFNFVLNVINSSVENS